VLKEKRGPEQRRRRRFKIRDVSKRKNKGRHTDNGEEKGGKPQGAEKKVGVLKEEKNLNNIHERAEASRNNKCSKKGH